MDIPRFNNDEIKYINIIDSDSKAKFNFKQLLNKVSELNNKLFFKNKSFKL